MQSPSKLKASAPSLFLDASALINLVASGYGEPILMALRCPIFVPEHVCAEFKRHPREGASAETLMRDLRTRGRIQISVLSNEQLEVFIELTGAPAPDDLGDGEAATLACAAGLGAAVIDDKKAIRIACNRFPNQQVYCSLDLMASQQVLKSLGQPTAAQAIFEAIRIARMRVPRVWMHWVCTLLGKDRLTQLPWLRPLPRT